MAISDRVNIILSLKNKMGAGLNKASAKLNQFAVRTREAGQAMAIGSAVMGAGIWKATDLAVKLDDEMRKTQGRIGGVTDGEMADLRSMVKELGRTTSFTTMEVAALVSKLAQSGESAGSIQKLTKPMLEFARATGITAEQAAEFTQQTLKSFGLGIEDAAHVTDVLTFAANNSFQSVEDLGEAMKFAAVISKQTGQGLEGTVASLALMADVGIKGTNAGRQIRKVLVDLAKNGSDVADELGVSLETVDGKVRALPLILADFIDATKDMTELERLGKFNEAFGKIGLNASIIAGEGAGKIMELANGLKHLEGTAAKTSATMDGGIGGTLRRLWSAIEGSVLAIGESLAPVLEQAASGVTIFSNVLTPLIEKTSWIGPLLGGIFAAMAVGGVTLLGLAGVATVVSAALGAVGTVISLVTALFGGLAATVTATAGLVMSPIGLIAVALAALIVATVDFKAVWADVSAFAVAQWNLVANTFQKAFGGIMAAIEKGDLELAMQIAMKSIVVIVFGTLDNLFSKWRGVLMAITSTFANVADTVNTIWSNMIDGVSKGIIWVMEKLRIVSAETAESMRESQSMDQEAARKGASDTIRGIEQSANNLFGNSNDQRQRELDALIAKAKEAKDELKQPEKAKEIKEDMAVAQDAINKWIKNGVDYLTDLATDNIETTLTTGSIGATSLNQLNSQLAKSSQEIMKDQLTVTRSSNKFLGKIESTLSKGFWGN